MSATGNGSFKLPKNRMQLRTATLILPRTGERVKRTVTLREPPASDGHNSDGDSRGSSPLLAHRSPRRKNVGVMRVLLDDLADRLRGTWAFWTSKTGRGVFKCSLAYLLGSMATFVPFLAAFLGKQDGKHMVATVTVYFHPARSQGSMFEAVSFALLAFVYTAFISFTSMGVSVLVGSTLDHITLAHVIVLIVFCGGGLGFVGWTKQKLENPLVNVACSLTSLGIITVLTKEGSVQAAEFSEDKVVQVMKMVIMGIIASTAMNFLVFPVSARKELRENMRQVTDSFGDMLAMITRSFLTGTEHELEKRAFVAASDRYRSVLASLTKNLKEAKYEHYVFGTEAEYHLEAKLEKCMKRMAQNIGGLRSAATTQFSLLAQSNAAGGATPITAGHTPVSLLGLTMSDSWISSQESSRGLTVIDETPEIRGSIVEPAESANQGSTENSSYDATARSPAEIFERFISHLGPSMKSLAYTLKQILDELPYGPGPDFKIAVNMHFESSLVEAVSLYSNARQEALALLYKDKELKGTLPVEVEADFEEVAASCGHFSFSLQDFAEEMRTYLEILDDLKLAITQTPRRRSWKWVNLWRRHRTTKDPSQKDDPERESLLGHTASPVIENLRNLVERSSTSTVSKERPGGSRSYGYRLWKALRIFRQDDIRFAIKVGVGAALFALPSFVPATRPIYAHWRGEWGLLSYMLVCSMTIGASNTTGYARFLGTCIGAVCSMATWTASRGNAFALAAFGWLMSLFTSYLIVAKAQGPMGRFIMLTYNLSALYAYSLSVRDLDDDDDEGGIDPIITEIALHRLVAVLSGCLWGLVVTRILWPISARRKFKDGLSLLWLRMGLIWKRDPLATLLEGDSPNPYMNLREEFELQKFVSSLDGLRSSAASEFELRGPFPTVLYGRILKSTSKMLDAFHAMNVVIMKDSKASKGEAEILKYTTDERAQLCSRISHLFQVLASSMKLQYPLNDALPNTDNARDRLLAKIFAFRKNVNISEDTSDEDYALLYAYALVTGQLSKEIREVGKEIENLFGFLDEDLLKLQ